MGADAGVKDLNLQTATIDAVLKFVSNAPFAALLAYVLWFNFTSRNELDREMIAVITRQVAAFESNSAAVNRWATAVEGISKTNLEIAAGEKAERKEMMTLMAQQSDRRDAEIEVLKEILIQIRSTKRE